MNPVLKVLLCRSTWSSGPRSWPPGESDPACRQSARLRQIINKHWTILLWNTGIWWEEQHMFACGRREACWVSGRRMKGWADVCVWGGHRRVMRQEEREGGAAGRKLCVSIPWKAEIVLLNTARMGWGWGWHLHVASRNTHNMFCASAHSTQTFIISHQIWWNFLVSDFCRLLVPTLYLYPLSSSLNMKQTRKCQTLQYLKRPLEGGLQSDFISSHMLKTSICMRAHHVQNYFIVYYFSIHDSCGMIWMFFV